MKIPFALVKDSISSPLIIELLTAKEKGPQSLQSASPASQTELPQQFGSGAKLEQVNGLSWQSKNDRSRWNDKKLDSIHSHTCICFACPYFTAIACNITISIVHTWWNNRIKCVAKPSDDEWKKCETSYYALPRIFMNSLVFWLTNYPLLIRRWTVCG